MRRIAALGMLATAVLLVAAMAAGWLFWQSRSYPAAAAAFVFRDGFEDAVKTGDLFPRDFSRWHGRQRESGAGATANEVALTTERAHSGTHALKCVAAPYDGRTASKADIQREGLRFVKGDDVWFRGWFWLAGGTDASLVFIWDLETTALHNSPGRRLYLQNGEWLASDLGKWWTGKTFRQPRGREVRFPKERGVELRVHLFLSDGSSSFLMNHFSQLRVKRARLSVVTKHRSLSLRPGRAGPNLGACSSSATAAGRAARPTVRCCWSKA